MLKTFSLAYVITETLQDDIIDHHDVIFLIHFKYGQVRQNA